MHRRAFLTAAAALAGQMLSARQASATVVSSVQIMPPAVWRNAARLFALA